MLAAMELAVTAVPEDAIDPLVAVTANAFIDEQLLRWPLGDHPDPLRVMQAEFRGLHLAAARLGCLCGRPAMRPVRRRGSARTRRTRSGSS